MPLIAIESLLTQQSIAAINDKASAALNIIISRNAAELIIPNMPLAPNYKFATVGPATAKYLQMHGIQNIFYPQKSPYNSASLLQVLLNKHPNLADQSITILTGAEGDGNLAKDLRKTLAKVEIIPIYKRIMPKNAARQFKKIFNNDRFVDIILITCVTSLVNLMQLAYNESISLYAVPLLVISPRISKYAKAQGFKNVYVARSMEEDDILLALENYRCIYARTS